MHVRIGIANAKELEVKIEDADGLIAAYEKALKDDQAMMTIEEHGGSRMIVAVGAILYFALDAPEKPGIGFAQEG